MDVTTETRTSLDIIQRLGWRAAFRYPLEQEAHSADVAFERRPRLRRFPESPQYGELYLNTRAVRAIAPPCADIL